MHNENEYEGLDKEALLTILAETEKLANVGGWEWDILSDIWTFSDNWLRIHGCTKRHLSTPELLPIAHPDDRPRIQKAFDRAVSEGVNYEIEHRIIKQDTGEERYVRSFGSARLDKSGNPLKIYGSVQDITGQKLAEEALHKERVLFRTIVDRLPIMITRYDPDANMLFLNSEFEKKIGWTTEDVQDIDIMKAVYPDPEYREQAYAYMQKASREWREFRVTSKSGQIIESQWSNIRLEDGTQVGIGIDITESKKVKKSLKESEKRFVLAMEFANDGLWDWNVETNEIYYSPAWKRMLGYKDDELPNDFTVWETLTDPEDVRRSWKMQKELINKKRDKFEIEFKMRHKDGHWVDILSRANAIFNENREAVRIVGTHVDISERKKNENRLRENEQRYKSAQRMGKVGNWEYDFVTETFWGSDYAKQIYGFDPESERFTTDEVENCIPERERVHQALIDLIEKDKPYKLEFDIHPISGPETRTIRSTAEIQRDETGTPLKVIGVVHDITEQKKSREQKEKLEKELVQAQKMESIGTLAGGIAHEFNNILSIIIGNNELIMEDLPDWSLSRDNCDGIRLAGLRARDVVKHLLTFSRQDDSTKKPMDIASAVKETFTLVRATTPANIDIRESISPECLPVFGDPTQINQILINLCNNAAYALPISGGRIDIELFNTAVTPDTDPLTENLAPGEYVCLRVRDNGSGMEKEILDRIFEPYFTTKDVGEGSGIGLAVVHGIVENHGGSIVCESTKGLGATFTILIPAFEGSLGEESDNQDVDVVHGNGETILYVDDEPAIAELGRRRLEALGYTAFSSTDPIEAIELIKTDPDRFELVISDMAMPNMPGDQLIGELLAINPRLPAMICTGYSSRMSETKATEMGVKALVMKPLNKYELAETVRRVLDEAKGTGQQ